MRSWNGEFISPRTSAYATIKAVAGTYASSSVAVAADTRVAHATRPVATDAIRTLAAANRYTLVRLLIRILLTVTDYTGRAARRFRSPLEQIFTALDRAHREPQGNDGRRQQHRHTRRIGLKVMRDCEPAHVPGQDRGQLLPSEYEQKSADERTPEQRAGPQEDSAICSKAEREHSE